MDIDVLSRFSNGSRKLDDGTIEGGTVKNHISDLKYESKVEAEIDGWRNIERHPACLVPKENGGYVFKATQILYEEPDLYLQGFSENGGSVCAIVKNFTPSFYVKLPPSIDSVDDLKDALNGNFRYCCSERAASCEFEGARRRHFKMLGFLGEETCRRIAEGEIDVVTDAVLHHKYATDGFHFNTKSRFAYVSCPTLTIMRQVARTVSTGFRNRGQEYEKCPTFDHDAIQEIDFMINNDVTGFCWVSVTGAHLITHHTRTDNSVELECRVEGVKRFIFAPPAAEPAVKRRYVTLDIECINCDGTMGFPNPFLIGRVSNIALELYLRLPGKPSERINSFVLCLKKTDPIDRARGHVVWFNTERELLIEFFHLMRVMQPDVVDHYNGKRFDFPFVLIRAKILGLTEQITRFHRHKFVTEECESEQDIEDKVERARAIDRAVGLDWTATDVQTPPWREEEEEKKAAAARAGQKRKRPDSPTEAPPHKKRTRPNEAVPDEVDHRDSRDRFGRTDDVLTRAKEEIARRNQNAKKKNDEDEESNAPKEKVGLEGDYRTLDEESRKDFVALSHGFDAKVHRLHGVVSVDVMDGVKAMKPTLMSYKLDSVCVDILSQKDSNKDALIGEEDIMTRIKNGEDPMAVLGKVAGQNRKEDIPGWLITRFHGGTPAERALLASYNLKDVVLTHLVHDKLNITENFESLANVAGINAQQVVDAGQSTKGVAMLRKFAKKKDAVFCGFSLKNKDRQKAWADNKTAADGQDGAPQGNNKKAQKKPAKGARGKPKYEGAYVVDPKKIGTVGYHRKFIGPVDFKSLYPSNMRAFDLCISTLIRADKVRGLTAEQVAQSYGLVRGVDYTVTPKGLVFVQRPDPKRPDACRWLGIAPEVEEFLVAKRREIQKALGAAAKGSTEALLLDIQQNAVKTMANALYGVLALISEEVGESVTSWGQYFIKFADEQVPKFMPPKAVRRPKTFYGDTDSLYIDLGIPEPPMPEAPNRNPTFQNLLNDAGESLLALRDYLNECIAAEAVRLGGWPGYLMMEQEGVMFPFLLSSKKVYAAWVHKIKTDDVGNLLVPTQVEVKGEPKNMGTKSKRRDSCLYAINIQKKLFQCLLEQESPELAVEASYKFMKDFGNNKLSPYGFTITKGLTRSLEEYAESGAPPQAHVRMAMEIARRDPASKPVKGARISYIVVKRKIGEKKAKAGVGDKVELPEVVVSEGIPIDKEYYFDHQLLEPIRIVMKGVLCKNGGLKTEKESGRVKSEWSENTYRLDTYFKSEKMVNTKGKLPELGEFINKMKHYAFNGDGTCNDVMSRLSSVPYRPGTAGGRKNVIGDMLRGAGAVVRPKCRLCNCQISAADDSEGVNSDFCDMCVEKHTLEGLRKAVEEKRQYHADVYKTIYNFCTECVKNSIKDPDQCFSTGCPVFSHRVVSKIQLERISSIRVGAPRRRTTDADRAPPAPAAPIRKPDTKDTKTFPLAKKPVKTVSPAKRHKNPATKKTPVEITEVSPFHYDAFLW